MHIVARRLDILLLLFFSYFIGLPSTSKKLRGGKFSS
jgi:hypothetical protein